MLLDTKPGPPLPKPWQRLPGRYAQHAPHRRACNKKIGSKRFQYQTLGESNNTFQGHFVRPTAPSPPNRAAAKPASHAPKKSPPTSATPPHSSRSSAALESPRAEPEKPDEGPSKRLHPPIEGWRRAALPVRRSKGWQAASRRFLEQRLGPHDRFGRRQKRGSTRRGRLGELGSSGRVSAER